MPAPRPHLAAQQAPAQTPPPAPPPAPAPGGEGTGATDGLMTRGYAAMGLRAPPVTPLAASELPAPLAPLLDHSGGMTQTLATHWRAPVGLTVRHRALADGWVRRAIVLSIPARPVAFGLIEINLAPLPVAVRDGVLAEGTPFGALLRAAGLPFASRPLHFFQVAADPLLAECLAVPEGQTLHGRETMLSADLTPIGPTGGTAAKAAQEGQWHPVARVLEILPPLLTEKT